MYATPKKISQLTLASLYHGTFVSFLFTSIMFWAYLLCRFSLRLNSSSLLKQVVCFLSTSSSICDPILSLLVTVKILHSFSHAYHYVLHECSIVQSTGSTCVRFVTGVIALSRNFIWRNNEGRTISARSLSLFLLRIRSKRSSEGNPSLS